MALTLFQQLEDHDNAELSDYERKEQLMEAVMDYNESYGKEYKPEREADRYLRRGFEEQQPDI